jgi:hypothetical protein
MHEQAAGALGVRYHYHLIEVAGAGREQLRALLDGVRRLGFAGVNVTFPYKEAVIDLLDELSPGAAAIGAVNTVVVRNHRLGVVLNVVCGVSNISMEDIIKGVWPFMIAQLVVLFLMVLFPPLVTVPAKWFGG